MTADDFRSLALALPGAEERAHMQHPDFRVRGKIFATLGSPDDEWAMVKLTPDQQELFVRLAPESFKPVKGSWGAKGATNVNLKKAKKKTAKEALLAAHANIAN
ncbi:MAG TPA: MmcQ/YjbR family DNA-binding protein [Thermoanaerobaculia bacterium]